VVIISNIHNTNLQHTTYSKTSPATRTIQAPLVLTTSSQMVIRLCRNIIAIIKLIEIEAGACGYEALNASAGDVETTRQVKMS